jgi:hypothetical protein
MLQQSPSGGKINILNEKNSDSNANRTCHTTVEHILALVFGMCFTLLHIFPLVEYSVYTLRLSSSQPQPNLLISRQCQLNVQSTLLHVNVYLSGCNCTVRQWYIYIYIYIYQSLGGT